MTTRPFALPTILLVIGSACETAPDAPRAPEAPAPPAAPQAPQDPHAPGGATAPVDAPPAAGELQFSAPPEWVVETPSSKMRKAQYRLPRADGDAEDASLVVYYFGPGGGGDRQANLDRWAGQFEQPDGSESAGHMKSTDRSIMGTTFTDVDLSGTYVAETSPGSGERLRKEGWRMLATIIHTGPYYVKLVGPAATVARWEPSYRRFVDTAKPIR